MNKINKINNMSFITNPLFVIVMLLIVLIIVLAIFRSVSPFLNLGLGINAHIGDLRGSFKIEAFDNNNTSDQMFVMYYADWCGHCKTTKPEFKKLMDNYKGNAKVVMVNSESPENKELVKQQEIKGYPTIRYYPSGLNSNYQEYSGARTYSDFIEYLGNISGTQDQAPDNAAPY
jgi:thiol-disulfide isomerase/thioredoxin